MRPDDINPRTGLVVALVSVFLVFGFMFTVSGIKGETLGDIPLLAIGPAICLPGIAAIALARKTDGCTKWPQQVQRCCPPANCCRKKPRDKDALELLRTPSDLESGKGSCDELAQKTFACPGRRRASLAGGVGEGGGRGDSLSTCTAAAGEEGRRSSSVRRAEQEELLRYLENCYPEMPGNVFVAEATPYSALAREREREQQQESPAAVEVATGCEATTSTTTAITEDNLFVAPRDTVIVCSYKEGSPYDRYCCYINPSQDISSDHETVV